jgi:hypothetical protein
MLKTTLTLVIVLVITGNISAQASVTLGKKEIPLPERCILDEDKGYVMHKNYIEFRQDTLYYYQVSIDKDDHKYDELEKFTVPFNLIPSDYFHYQHCITEYLDGHVENRYSIWINIMEDSPTKTVWCYKYNRKGAMRKKRQGYLNIYCNSRIVYDDIKAKIAAK